jgi:hypothetical protein
MPQKLGWKSPVKVKTDMKVRFEFADRDFVAALNGTVAAREFLAMLPLELQIEDYAHNEKIAYLPSKLATRGNGAFSDEKPGDLCYYAPWGNLVFFYAPYRYSAGLIRLGHLLDGVAPLSKRGRYPLRAEIMTDHP